LPELPAAAIDGANGVGGGGDGQGDHLEPNGFSGEHPGDQPDQDTLPGAVVPSAGVDGSPAVKQEQEQDEPAHGQHVPPADGVGEPNPDDSLDYDPALVDLNDPAHYTPAEVHQPLPDVGEGGGQEVDPVMAFMQQTLLAGLGGGEAAVDGEAGGGGYGLGMEVDGQQ